MTDFSPYEDIEALKRLQRHGDPFASLVARTLLAILSHLGMLQ